MAQQIKRMTHTQRRAILSVSKYHKTEGQMVRVPPRWAEPVQQLPTRSYCLLLHR